MATNQREISRAFRFAALPAESSILAIYWICPIYYPLHTPRPSLLAGDLCLTTHNPASPMSEPCRLLNVIRGPSSNSRLERVVCQHMFLRIKCDRLSFRLFAVRW